MIQDVGVSDGRTSCDFFKRLRSRFPNILYCASDYGVCLRTVKSGGIQVVLNAATDRLLEVVYRSFVFGSLLAK
ncbi:MAG: hypothetical protein LBJ70_03105 [Holosporales bacterium]|nr:hypothetical protein [Holosporales bacterium]